MYQIGKILTSTLIDTHTRWGPGKSGSKLSTKIKEFTQYQTQSKFRAVFHNWQVKSSEPIHKATIISNVNFFLSLQWFLDCGDWKLNSFQSDRNYMEIWLKKFKLYHMNKSCTICLTGRATCTDTNVYIVNVFCNTLSTR